MAEPTPPPLPTELSVLPLRSTVAFPLTLQPLAVTRGVSIETVNRALGADRLILLVLQDNESEDPGPEDLRKIGTVAIIRQMAKAGMGINIILEGLARVRLDSVMRTGTSMRAHITPMPEPFEQTLEVDAHVRRIQELIDKTLSLASGLSEELRGLVMTIDNPLRLVYVLSTLLDLRPPDKQAILEESDLVKKLQAVATALTREVSLLELKGKIESQAQQEMTDAQRQYFLRQQMKAIQQELGEGESAELTELRKGIDDANLPEAIHTVATREVERLSRMTAQSPEYQMIRTYLDWILELPWSVTTQDRLDPVEARRVLDDDHYDLDKVKERIVEYLAVRKLKGDMKGPILCFVGPPGVGKTSLGQSIARAMNRKFVRISLGGVRDEAEIRGHRRTYIGSIPGRVVQALKQAGAMNPVFMLDEIDKMAAGIQGDPAAALLEVLDPAQNHSFRDHYLEAPVDLSRVLFIATSNQLGTVHPALLDRMEIIQLAGYTEEEKVHIARRYLLPRQMTEHGLAPDTMAVSDGALHTIISEYTREAGVRNLERQLGTIARKVAARIATRPADAPPVAQTVVDSAEVDDYLGPARFKKEVAFRTSMPGVVTGVAWTEVGGDVLFIEVTLLPGGNQNIILTGQLGNVMQESARAALSHIRSRAEALGISPEFLAKHDLHIHVPAGAIPKDGPSAGITIATAILSAARHQAVKPGVAMTGEITLSGLVLPVGGIREKALAARRFGVKTFVLPALNEPDLLELPEELRRDMTFVPVETLEQVVKVAFDEKSS
ncbi:MAG TPA: endopeptidase La [Vicinamibacterales bacterium]|jgi:endopeptidase La|nr:endopeptidase La [Vicinamibacterales bacterium]